MNVDQKRSMLHYLNQIMDYQKLTNLLALDVVKWIKQSWRKQMLKCNIQGCEEKFCTGSSIDSVHNHMRTHYYDLDALRKEQIKTLKAELNHAKSMIVERDDTIEALSEYGDDYYD